MKKQILYVALDDLTEADEDTRLRYILDTDKITEAARLRYRKLLNEMVEKAANTIGIFFESA